MKKTIMNTKKVLTVVIAIAMCISMLTVSAFAADVVPYDLWVGGVQVNSDNAADVLGDGTVSYNAEDNILTLNGADITEGYNPSDYVTIGIYADGDLNIELAEGSENEITTPGNESSYGIFVGGALCVSGKGNLSVTAGSCEGENADSCGIYTIGGLCIEQAKVFAYGGDATATGDYADTSGVFTRGDVVIDFGGSLVAVGGNANGATAYSDGICIYSDDYGTRYNVSVYDGYLETRGGNATGVHHAMSTGMYLDCTGLGVYEDSATVIIEAGDATVTSTDEASDPQAVSTGVYAYGVDVEIYAGNVTVSTGECTGLYKFSYGVLAGSHNYADGTSSGGYVRVYCNEAILNPYGPGFIGTTVNISSPDGAAIYTESGIEIEDTLIISEPENVIIEEAEDGFGIPGWTVLNSDGTHAENVTIEPLTCEVAINGLDYSMAIDVPAGKSLNEVYCEIYGVDDFSEILDTEKEGYTFGGFYTDEACTEGNEFDFDTLITEDITIYAKWTKAADDTQPGGSESGGNEQGGTTTDGNENNNQNTPDNEENKNPVADPEIPDTDGADSTVWFAMLMLSAMTLVAYATLGKKKFARK